MLFRLKLLHKLGGFPQKKKKLRARILKTETRLHLSLLLLQKNSARNNEDFFFI